MERKYNLIAVTLFIVALFAAPIYLFASKDIEFSDSENRYLAQMPTIRVGDVLSGTFMEDTEKYLDDQFPFRNIWTAMKSGIVQLAGNKEVNGVYLGEDGYLIEKWIANDFDESQLQKNMDAINYFSENHPNQKTSVMIIPTAGLILKDKLPKYAPMFDQNIAFDKIESSLSNSVFVDTRRTLFSKKNHCTYYKTDHHWTSYGAFLGYLKWCEQSGIQAETNAFSAEVVTDGFQGSLYSKVLNVNSDADKINIYIPKKKIEYSVSYNLGKSQSDSVYAFEHLGEKDKYQIFLNGNHPELTIKTNQTNGKHLLIFKDSFANSFIPFLVGDYESIHVIDLRYFNGNIENYITSNHVSEFLFLYNAKNFCEEKTIIKLSE